MTNKEFEKKSAEKPKKQKKNLKNKTKKKQMISNKQRKIFKIHQINFTNDISVYAR